MYISPLGLTPDPCLRHEQTTTSSTTIYIANGLCGSGKTFISSDQIAKGILGGERFLIAGPTTQQSGQHADAIRAALHRMKPRSMATMLVTEINAETERRAVADGHQPTVAQMITSTAAAAPEGKGRAICITHAALANMPRKATPSGWHLIIDEAPASVIPAEVELPTLYLRAMRFVTDDRDGFRRLRADLDHLGEIKRDAEQQVRDLEGLRRKGDPDHKLDVEIARRRSIRDTLTDIFYKVKSGNWRILARQNALEADGRHRMKLRLPDTAYDEARADQHDRLAGHGRHRRAEVAVGDHHGRQHPPKLRRHHLAAAGL